MERWPVQPYTVEQRLFACHITRGSLSMHRKQKNTSRFIIILSTNNAGSGLSQAHVYPTLGMNRATKSGALHERSSARSNFLCLTQCRVPYAMSCCRASSSYSIAGKYLSREPPPLSDDVVSVLGIPRRCHLSADDPAQHLLA